MIICGIDEAGRGCIAGSMFMCGVILYDNFDIPIKDSKQLSEKTRFKLLDKIKQNCKYHIVKKTPKEIDEYGLSMCLKESLQEIIYTLKADKYIFDGNCNFKINKIETLIKGDSKLSCISAASILAKCAKDTEMIDIHDKYRCYNFQKNKGYGTKEHMLAIEKYGLCDIHRLSYKITTKLA